MFCVVSSWPSGEEDMKFELKLNWSLERGSPGDCIVRPCLLAGGLVIYIILWSFTFFFFVGVEVLSRSEVSRGGLLVGMQERLGPFLSCIHLALLSSGDHLTRVHPHPPITAHPWQLGPNITVRSWHCTFPITDILQSLLLDGWEWEKVQPSVLTSTLGKVLWALLCCEWVEIFKHDHDKWRKKKKRIRKTFKQS